MENQSHGRSWGILFLLTLLVVPVILFLLWTWISVHWTYSNGERAGFVQKISKKGWLCKTWEGELAMANLPGTMPQIFLFSVPDETVAHQIEKTMGQKVSLSYEQHRGVPTSCLAETEFFVNKIQSVGEPAAAPGIPGPIPQK